jgi:molybdopterin/thiamine biosynthesis adenylyltransferase/molybdopterin synthase catalytic subunit
LKDQKSSLFHQWQEADLFSISDQSLNRDELHEALVNTQAGAIVVFEGWVRNHNEGKQVSSLEYQVYRELALKEGARILDEAKEKFNLHHVVSVHREGHLKLGEIAIWIGATASHRDDAFKATRFVIDEIKHRLPVWKKEHYVNEKPEWVFCRHQHHHVNFQEADYYQKQSKLTDQNKLKKSHVLVIGAGGLGCPALVNLATAGIGLLRIVDFDSISISNIHRQFLYSPNLVGEKKAVVAKSRLLELNPFIKVEAITQSFTPEHLANVDLVLDCTDNMATKYLIHDACFKHSIPLISAGIYKHEGQVRTFIPGKGCLRCHVTTTPDDGLLGNCNDFGVLGATTSVLGSIQASEALEFLVTGANATSVSTLHMNLKTLSQTKIKNIAKADCPVCHGQVELELNTLEVDSVGAAHLIDIRHLSDAEIQNLNFSREVVLSCHRGVRSKKVAESLRAQGHSQVFSLKGGANCSH